MKKEITYSIEEASKLSGKSVKVIRKSIAEETLIAAKIDGKYMINKSSFNNWFSNHDDCRSQKSIFDEIKSENNDAKVANFIDVSHEWQRNGWSNKRDQNGLNFIDLFSGAGGLSLGFVMAGYNPIGSVEIMPQAIDTYKTNFINKKGFDEYVETRDIREKNIKKALYESVKGKKVDVICGGFPCQGFSMAGNRIVTDARNTLYIDMLDIVKNLKPSVVVMENVVGLRSMLGGKVEDKIINDFKQIGYEINVTILNAADYHTPQTRRRIIFVGNRINKTNYHPKPMLKQEEYITVGQAIGDLINIEENSAFNHKPTNHSKKMQERLMEVKEGSSLYENYSDSWKKCIWNKPAPTIKENHGAVNIHPKLPRVLTAREMARLQSFPDDFEFKGTKKWQLVQIGNAVPPLLGKAIALAVEKTILD